MSEEIRRSSGIGGTDISAILGLNKWSSPYDVWTKKKGYGFPVQENDPMMWGTLLEPVVADFYSRKTGVELRSVERQRHPDHPWYLGTPDRLSAQHETPMVLEVKTAGVHVMSNWGPAESGPAGVPDQYNLQLRWYLGLPMFEGEHASYGDIAVLLAGQDFRIYRLWRDTRIEDMLKEQAEKFWNAYIIGDGQPPYDGSDAATRFLHDKFKDSTQEMVKDDTPIVEWVHRLKEAREKIAQAKQDEEIAKQYVKDYIGNKRGVTGEWGRIVWSRMPGKKTISWKRMVMKLIEDGIIPQSLLEDFTSKGNDYSAFRPTFNKESV